jgi:hypothetical protein
MCCGEVGERGKALNFDALKTEMEGCGSRNGILGYKRLLWKERKASML